MTTEDSTRLQLFKFIFCNLLLFSIVLSVHDHRKGEENN